MVHMLDENHSFLQKVKAEVVRIKTEQGDDEILAFSNVNGHGSYVCETLVLKSKHKFNVLSVNAVKSGGKDADVQLLKKNTADHLAGLIDIKFTVRDCVGVASESKDILGLLHLSRLWFDVLFKNMALYVNHELAFDTEAYADALLSQKPNLLGLPIGINLL
jgi:hypothetical protein